jgi:hypothetical protein
MPLTRVLNHNITDRDVTEIKFAEGLIDSLSSTITIENFDPKFNTVTITDNTFTAIDDTAVNVGGGHIVITGENFAEGATVIVDNTPASSVNRVNSTTLQVQVPAKAAASYNLFVVNPDGGTAIKINAITYSANPAWVTASPLTSQSSNVSFAINFSAPSATSYALANGSSLPAGTTLLSNGYFFGTVSVGAETLFSFDVIATDAENQDASKSFSVSVVNAPVVTSVQVANNTFTVLDDTAVNTGGGFIVVTGEYFANGATVLVAATPATSVTYVSNTTLRVQVPARAAASYNVSVSNPDGRTGTLVNGITYSAAPVWVTESNVRQVGNNREFNVNLSATPAVSYAVANGSSLPAGTQLLANGYFFGTVSVGSDTTFTFSVVAIDSENQDTTKSLSITAIANPREWWNWTVSSPSQVGTDADWSQISGSYGVKAGGQLYSVTTQIGALTNWAFVNQGGARIAAIKTNGTLWTWGPNVGTSNVWGELGSNDRVTRSSPQQVGSLTNWAYVSAAAFNMHAIKTDGTLWAWGRNTYGQLAANLLISVHRSSPIQIGTDTNWSKVANSENSVLAIRTNGTLWAWGNNLFGNLGINSRTEQLYSPRQVGALTNWKEIETNALWTHAIKTDGTLWGWGRQWNTSADTDRSSPVQIGTDTNWSKLGGSSGIGGAAALKTNGQIWSWYPNAPALAATTSKTWVEISGSGALT